MRSPIMLDDPVMKVMQIEYYKVGVLMDIIAIPIFVLQGPVSDIISGMVMTDLLLIILMQSLFYWYRHILKVGTILILMPNAS